MDRTFPDGSVPVTHLTYIDKCFNVSILYSRNFRRYHAHDFINTYSSSNDTITVEVCYIAYC